MKGRLNTLEINGTFSLIHTYVPYCATVCTCFTTVLRILLVQCLYIPTDTRRFYYSTFSCVDEMTNNLIGVI